MIAAPPSRLLLTRLLDIGGHALRYHSQGSGPDVLLLHGFPETLQAWVGHAEVLGSHWRVHAFDWMGLGGSDAPADFEYSYEGYARLLTAVLDRLGLQRVHIVATDIALPPALLFAIDHPERVRSLLVFDGPVFDRPAYVSWEVRGLRTPPIGELMVHAFPRTMFWIAMQRGFYRSPAIAPDVWEDFHAQIRRQRCREVTLQLFRNYEPALQRIERSIGRLREMPVRILWGANDVFVDPRMGEALRDALPQARLTIAPQCGHFLAAEMPAFFNDQLTDFLVSNDA